MSRLKLHWVSACLLLLVSVTAGAQSAPSGGGWLARQLTWLADTFARYWTAAKDYFNDFSVKLFHGVFDSFASAVEAIGVPSFIEEHSLGALLGNAGATVAWALDTCKVGEGIGIVGAAWAFRLLRKLLTLGQW